jgi:hypothetical protein
MFGRPMRLEAEERVWLVARQLPPGAQVQVNEHDVGQVDHTGTWLMDITSLLQVRNRLSVILPGKAEGVAVEDGRDQRKTLPEATQDDEVAPTANFMVTMCIYGPDNTSS